MFPPRKILVVDDNVENGALLVRTLIRKFPGAVVELCQESGAATETAASEHLDIALVHRSAEDNVVELIRALLAVNPDLPIIAISGVDRSEHALSAGAAGFLLYDEWLRVGAIVADVLRERTEA